MKSRLFLAITLLSIPGHASSQDAPVAESRPRWAAPELDSAVAVRDGRTGKRLSFARLLDVLATADAVFLGEYHTDETTHRVELGVYEGIAARRSGKVVLAMEMFERDVQAALDSYLAGKSTEQQFLSESRPWKNYATGYRPLIEFAKKRGLSVVASNFPKPLRRRFAMKQGQSLDDLKGSQRSQAPAELFANSPAYWRRVDNAIRGHIGMMRVDQSDTKRLYSTQSLWDNSMGEACALALDKHEGSSVLHVNGGFHSAYWDGTVRQLRLRKPDAKILTVSIVPTSNPGVSLPKGAAAVDYFVYAETRATDVNEGKHAVYVSRKVEYRLHLPKTARTGQRVPLLIWFADDGFTAKNGMALWRRRLGDECAIAVVEAPYRETQEDLVDGGRWFWPDSFASDVSTMRVATERIWAYLLRHHPIDPARVCIAGEGTGATVVATVSLGSQRMDARAIAFAPRQYSKIKDIPLPLPEFRGDDRKPEKSLRLLLGPNDERWWARELAEYKAIGFESTMQTVTKDAWLLATERENALRTALSLEVSIAAGGARRRHILAASPRARLWARLMAAKLAKKDGGLVAVLAESPRDGASVKLDVTVRPEDFVSGSRIPRCPGSFGGTTVIVLPESTPPQVVNAWLDIEANDPFQKVSRFHRIRVATATEGDGNGDRALPAVLTELAKNGRRNVLIVPATFCADGATMRALRKSTRAIENQMTLRWRPGLGG